MLLGDAHVVHALNCENEEIDENADLRGSDVKALSEWQIPKIADWL